VKLIFFFYLSLAYVDTNGKKVNNVFEERVLKGIYTLFTSLEDTTILVEKKIVFQHQELQLTLQQLFGLGNGEFFFTRKVYKEVAENISRNMNNNCNRVILSGTPGIGKSLFGLYWIWFVLRFHKENTVGKNLVLVLIVLIFIF
jgi:hypothetical protein